MNKVKLIIDGQHLDATSQKTFIRKNPLTGDVASIAPASKKENILSAINAASRAFLIWSSLSPERKRKIFLSAARILETKTSELNKVIIAETGSSSNWTDFNVSLGVSMLEEAAALSTQSIGKIIPSNISGSLAMSIRQPYGVVVSIAPWNAPVILGIRAIATPLVCGNTIVLKGSEICPKTHQIIVDVLLEAGIPNGVINYITNAPEDAPEIVETLISNREVKKVSFTGSTQVGKTIALTCAKYLKPVVLELGGKAPLIILDDADIEAAVNAAAFGSFVNSGQVCMSTERIIVDNKIADTFVEKFVTKTSMLPFGDPLKGPVVLGSVVDMSTVNRCNELIDDALSKGGKLVYGGKSKDTLFNATIIDYVSKEMKIYYDESFGPVKGIVRVDGVDQAVACANDNDYGLSAAVFGKDLGRAFEVAKKIESGICHVNGPTVHDEAQMPFGGIKGSGYGRFGGKAGVKEFTELRWITMQTTPRNYPF